MLRLRFTVDGDERVVSLSEAEVRFGRGNENQVVLPDYSVSRRHAVVRPDGDAWVIQDLGSTNGVLVNHNPVQRRPIHAGDSLKIGVFEIQVEHEGAATAETPSPPDSADFLDPVVAPLQAAFGPPPSIAPPPGDSAISNATIVRSLSEFSAEYGLDSLPLGRDSSAIRQSKREALDEAYRSQVFGYLTRLARLLITTDSDDEILEYVMEIAFEALPVDRGFILLRDEETGELECDLVRINDRVELRPSTEVPISKTMLESVMRERVALLTYDALSDRRLAGTESVRIHQIRAAMVAPLWSGEKIIGVIQLDTPHHTGSFTENDVDLLAALANFCAVAIERIRNARAAEYERQVRGRLERYHSPAVIEEVMHGEDSAAGEGFQRLKQAEVSVLFADLVGFTAFSENSEPEAVAELMEGYFTHAVEAIFSEGGTLDKFIGDCVMAFFGAPMAQGDHAQRATRAAIRIDELLEAWNADREARGVPTMATRIAINSGPVVVGDIGSNRRVDYTVLGNTVNVAARLEESVAAPGDIVLGERTHQLLDGLVETEVLGEFQLKGLTKKIVAHRIVRS